MATFTRKDLVDKLSAEHSGLSKIALDSIVCDAFNNIVAAAQNGDKVVVRGFGVFEVVDAPARTGRNPATGEPVSIPARRKFKFRPAKELRDI